MIFYLNIYIYVQLITGHCRLNVHQHRFAFIDSPACRCDAEQETIAHSYSSVPSSVSLDCPLNQLVFVNCLLGHLISLLFLPALKFGLSLFYSQSHQVDSTLGSRPESLNRLANPLFTLYILIRVGIFSRLLYFCIFPS